MTLLGLSTCDTCRKALTALRAAGHDATLRDVRAAPLSPQEIARLLAAFGDGLVNRASATWRALPEDERRRTAAELLAAHPALMKRPVIEAGQLIEAGQRLTLGWDRDAQAVWL